MSKNVSNRDRLIRVAIAVVAVIGALVVGGSSVLGVVLLVGAAIMVVTAGVGFARSTGFSGSVRTRVHRRPMPGFEASPPGPSEGPCNHYTPWGTIGHRANVRRCHRVQPRNLRHVSQGHLLRLRHARRPSAGQRARR